MKTGKIIQVLGPVVDVSFEDEELPAIKDALEVKNGDKKCIMEVAQHIGNHTVRCIMLASSEGLCRDMEVRWIYSYAIYRGIELIKLRSVSRHWEDCSTY